MGQNLEFKAFSRNFLAWEDPGPSLPECHKFVNDTFACSATSSQLLNKKIEVNKSKSFTNFVLKTVFDSSIACLPLNLETEVADLASLLCLQNWHFHLD